MYIQESENEKIERKYFHEIDPIKFKTTIEIVPPSLQIEFIQDDNFFFDVSLGDLVEDFKVILRKY